MITLRVNGVERRFDGDPGTPLLWFLRDELGLTGTKVRLRHRAVRRVHGARQRRSRHAPASRPCRTRPARP